MKKRTGILLLMGLALVAITTFQISWLMENYRREKRNLDLNLKVNFSDAIRDLQIKKLNLTLSPGANDSGQHKMFRVFVNNQESSSPDGLPGKTAIVSTINVIRDKMLDSMGREVHIRMDSIRHHLPEGDVDVTLRRAEPSVTLIQRNEFPEPGSNRFIDLLYGVDSLQDSLRIKDIYQLFQTKLKQNRIYMDVQVDRIDSLPPGKPAINEIPVGLAHPILYRYTAPHSGYYLFHRILQPILLSAFLIGIILASFIVLYRSLRQQQRLAEQKNEFISNITHELKTPIATVGVAIEALKNFNAANDPQKTKEYLDISTQELQRLSLLVDKVLKLSLFEKKDMDLRLENVSLGDLVQEVLDSLRLQAEKYKATITVEKSGDLNLKADRLHLLSVIFNLLDNALKYRSADPVIQIRETGTENEIILAVSDNGIGIPPEYREKIFEKFFRVPHGDTHNAKGYGLGLSYVAQVVKLHGGRIEAGPGIGSGTTFTIHIPRKV